MRYDEDMVATAGNAPETDSLSESRTPRVPPEMVEDPILVESNSTRWSEKQFEETRQI